MSNKDPNVITEEEYKASFEDPLPPTEADEEEPSPEPSKESTSKPVLNTKTVVVDGEEYSEVELANILRMHKSAKTKRVLLPETRASRPGRVLVARCLVKIDPFGSTIQKGYQSIPIDKEGKQVQEYPADVVTPAEVLLLSACHGPKVGGLPILGLEILGEINLSEREEVRRLKGKYGEELVGSLFPGAIPSLPQTFADAILLGNETNLPSTSMVGGVEVPKASLQFNVKALKND